MKTIKANFEIQEDVWDQFFIECRKNKTNASKQIRLMIAQYLKEVNNEKEYPHNN